MRYEIWKNIYTNSKIIDKKKFIDNIEKISKKALEKSINHCKKLLALNKSEWKYKKKSSFLKKHKKSLKNPK